MRSGLGVVRRSDQDVPAGDNFWMRSLQAACSLKTELGPPSSWTMLSGSLMLSVALDQSRTPPHEDAIGIEQVNIQSV